MGQIKLNQGFVVHYNLNSTENSYASLRIIKEKKINILSGVVLEPP